MKVQKDISKHFSYFWIFAAFSFIRCNFQNMVQFLKITLFKIHTSKFIALQYSLVVITADQLQSSKSELRFCAGSNPPWGVLEFCYEESLQQWSLWEQGSSSTSGAKEGKYMMLRHFHVATFCIRNENYLQCE